MRILTSLFVSYDPWTKGTGLVPAATIGRNVTAEALLNNGAKKIESLTDDPLTKAALMDDIGDALRSLGFFDKAKPLLEKSLEIRRKILLPDDPELARSLMHLGNWHSEKGDVDQAERYYLEAMAIHKKQGNLDHVDVATIQLRYAAILSLCSEPDAEKWAREGLATRLKLLGPQHRDTAIARLIVTTTLLEEGKTGDVLPTVMEALKYLSQEGKNEHGTTIEAMIKFQTGMMLMKTGLDGLAESSFRTCLESVQKTLGKDSIYTAFPLVELGHSLKKQGKLKEAETVYNESLQLARRTVGLGAPRIDLIAGRYAHLMADVSRPDQGMKVINEMLESQEKQFGPGCRWRLRSLLIGGGFACRIGKTPRAEELAREVISLVRKREKPLGRVDRIALGDFGNSLGDKADLKLVREVYELVFLQHQVAHDSKAYTDYSNFGQILVERKKSGEALPLLEKAWEQAKRSGGSTDQSRILHNFSLALRNEKRYVTAAFLCQEAFKSLPKLAADPFMPNRYTAARVAALAGCGQAERPSS